MASRYIGRFAPSPTGPLHFGSLVSALASYLDAKQHSGSWLVRIEDVDGTRCKSQYIEQILTTLNSYQLLSDESPIKQSDFTQEYQDHLNLLKQQDQIFPCNCTRQSLQAYQGRHPHICQSNELSPHSWRLKSSNVIYRYHDAIQGELIFQDDLKDNCPVLKRKDGYFSYQLAVVVDDHRQEISHLVRGADLIETTAQQLHLYALLDWEAPKISHIPLVVNQAGNKISKQNHAKAIQDGDLSTLLIALSYLGIEINASNITEALNKAIPLWNKEILRGRSTITLADQHLHLIQ
ncbi:tRNA glutamyl-Q(34) synthetase GluQRS [Marinomonas sp. THO17]|uniref:tRNA glutamyl-Q(34) synthetase GluQRS n=1 Tax=Marinomonas sp. THO17 TaxID=3149048 RepID=UPI00336C1B8A